MAQKCRITLLFTKKVLFICDSISLGDEKAAEVRTKQIVFDKTLHLIGKLTVKKRVLYLSIRS